MSERKITVIGRQVTEDRALLGKAKNWIYRQEEVSVEKIKSELTDFLTGMRDILTGLPDKMADYELESMDISIEISAKGNVSLVAIGGELGATGGLTLHLKKKSSSI
jgi:phage-related protein